MEYFYDPAKSGRRPLRNNSNVTGMSTNKNSEFKVPLPPRSVTQTVCSNSRPLQSNQEGSALQCLKPIVEKLELFDKLDILPQEELQKLTSELGQKLDSLCTNTLVQRLKQQNNNLAPSINNNSDLHTIISHAPVYQPSTRSCVCQGSTCASEIGYSIPKEILNNEPNLMPIPERPARSKLKPTPALAPDDGNDDSILSFFTNNGPKQNNKNAKKKYAPAVVTNTVEKKTKAVLASARTSRIDAVPRSQSVARSRSNAARPTQPRAQSAFRFSSEVISDDDGELMNSALKNEVSVVINQVSDRKLVKSNTRSKRKADSTAEPKKTKRVNHSKRADDINITKNSLRNFPLEPPKRSGKKSSNENSKNKRVSKKEKEAKENEPVYTVSKEGNREERNICGYDHTDQEMFGDFSTIINDSLQMKDSPNNILKNVTKVSTNKNDQPSHLFSPFTNMRSTSGLSAISTPLSKTLPKTIINKRLKKPDVASEFKSVKSQPIVKRIVRNDVVSLDASQQSEFVTSDFSDIEENSDEL